MILAASAGVSTAQVNTTLACTDNKIVITRGVNVQTLPCYTYSTYNSSLRLRNDGRTYMLIPSQTGMTLDSMTTIVKNCGCYGSAVPEVASGNYNIYVDFDFPVQTGTTPKKIIFKGSTYLSPTNSSMIIDSLQDFRATKAGTFKIDYTCNFLANATGQFYTQIYVNESVIAEPVLQSTSVVSGFLNFSGTVTTTLTPGDIVTMRLLRPSGTVTYTINHVNMTITKI